MEDATRIRNMDIPDIPGYQIIEEIGRGGMAVVYKALQISLGRYVALKVLSPRLANDPELVKRFQREAKAAAALKHPNIVTIYDVGKDNGWYFIAMEYVEGKSLKEYLSEKGPLSPEEAIRILKDVASALDYAHKQGFVHRDVKPSNVLIDAETGKAFLTDFGVVKALHEGTQLTRAGTFIGTVQYSSPEQIQGKSVGVKSDLYSFGIMAYEMFSGRPPFEGTVTAVMHAHVYESPPPLTGRVRGLTKEFDEIFGKILAKSPKNRYENAMEFVDDLEESLSSDTVRSRRRSGARLDSFLGRTLVLAALLAISVIAVMLLSSKPHTASVSKEQTFTAMTAVIQDRATGTAMARTHATSVAATHAQATATAVAATHAQAIATSVAAIHAQATATAAAQARATEVASILASAYSTATSVARTQGTATAIVSARKTATTRAHVHETATVRAARPPSCRIPVGEIFRDSWTRRGVYRTLGCPTGRAHYSKAAEERFQHGFMLWRDSSDSAYVLFDDGTWLRSQDHFVEGRDPEYSCGVHQSPPSPRRGFGKVWCFYPGVRDKIGNALEREVGYGMAGGGPAEMFQDFEGGMMYKSNHFNAIYVLFDNGTWQRQ